MSQTREEKVTIVGAGLAGSECAWQLAMRGVEVELIEQKPKKRTPAQTMDGFAELVCSNSFRGNALSNAVGLLKEEMRRAGSLVMAAGEVARVPAGGAFAVDRERFSEQVEGRLRAHPRVTIVEEEVLAIPERDHPVVLATGPLTGDALAKDLARVVGAEHLAYYDAIAPVVTAESIDFDKAFRKSRYDKGGDDYINCPMDEAQYNAFVKAVVEAKKVEPKGFEEVKYFEGCLPIEVIAERGPMTLSFGCMKPVGLEDPRTGKQPHAVVQLRQENADATAYNLVGFQTRMTWGEQKRVFATIPGLEKAEFVRLGSVHRNTFVCSPIALDDEYQLKNKPGVWLAGQISGVEGYVESAACGLTLGVMLAARVNGRPMIVPPETTALGGLLRHLRRERDDFQPANVMFSMVPRLPGRKIRKRRIRREKTSERALTDLEPWLDEVGARLVRAETFPEVATPAPEAVAVSPDDATALA